MTTASSARRRATHDATDHATRGACDLTLALDPALGLIASFQHLTPRLPGLPAAVRALLPAASDGTAGTIGGRGANLDLALASAVAVSLERQGLAELIRRGGHPAATVVATGARVLVNARRFAEQCSLGCAPDLAAAVAHATFESCERWALAAAVGGGRFLARLDERAAPLPVARILDWHRARGPQVTSLLVGRDTPVVACVAVPASDEHAIVIGVAAGRTCAAAWQAAAAELHQLVLTHAPRDRQGELRPGGIDGGVLATGARTAVDRAALAQAIAATRQVVEPGSVPAWSRTTDAVAVEVTTPAALRLGRRVVAVVTGESAERHALTLV